MGVSDEDNKFFFTIKKFFFSLLKFFFYHVKKQGPLQLDSDEKMSRFFDGCRKNIFFSLL
jgi:hypothetical protein